MLVPDHCTEHEIRICGLNVCGLNSKLKNGIFEDYIKKFHIICLSETKVKLDVKTENYECFKLPPNVKKYLYPGIHGINILVSNTYKGSVVQLQDDVVCDSALWIKVNAQFLLCSIYIPHEASKHFCNDIFDNLATDTSTLFAKYNLPIMLIGDFNSRTGMLDDFMAENEIVNSASPLLNYDGHIIK